MEEREWSIYNYNDEQFSEICEGIKKKIGFFKIPELDVLIRLLSGTNNSYVGLAAEEGMNRVYLKVSSPGAVVDEMVMDMLVAYLEEQGVTYIRDDFRHIRILKSDFERLFCQWEE